jgi:hypothetical protein
MASETVLQANFNPPPGCYGDAQSSIGRERASLSIGLDRPLSDAFQGIAIDG